METILTQQEAVKSIKLWAELSQSKEAVLTLLPKHKIFQLSRGNFEKYIAPLEGPEIQVYFGVIEGALMNELVLIWTVDNNVEHSYVASRVTISKKNIFLVDTLETRTTSYVELSSGLGMLANTSMSETEFLGSKNAISSDQAYAKIKNWSENYTDWASLTIDNNQQIVKAFSIPRSDVTGQFLNESIDYVNVLLGLYWSPLTNSTVPDLILAGNRTRPDGIVRLEAPNTTINEVTDLIRPCPPFCDESSFSFFQEG